MSSSYQITLCTCPDVETAHKIAQHLVSTNLAACINILPSVTSIYQWQGNIETAQEQLLLIKSHQQHYPMIESEIKRLHPYDVPEVVAVAIENGLPDYLNWINSCVLPE